MPGAKQKSRLRTMRNDLFNAHVYTEIKTHTDRIAVTFTYDPASTITTLLGQSCQSESSKRPVFLVAEAPAFAATCDLRQRRQWFHRVDIAFETCFNSSSSWILTFLTDCSMYDQCQDRRPHPPTPMPHPRNKVLVRGPVASYFG